MVELTDVNLTKWEKKRRKTLFVYTLQNIINGIGFSLVDITVWNYVTEMMDVKTPKLFYGLITAMVYLCPMILVTPISKWLSKTRKIRKLLISFNFFNIVGSLLYVIPFSPYYAMAARFFFGFNLILRSVITSELFHSYSDNELQQKITLMSLGVFIGEAIGSLTSFFFVNVEFSLGIIDFTFGNVCGIPIFLMTIIQLLLIIGVSYDVSNEYDLKPGEMGLNNNLLAANRQAVAECSTNERKSSPKFDYIFLLWFAFYCGVWIQLPIRLLPLVIENIEYPKGVVPILFLGYSILNIIILLMVVRIKFTNQAIYYSGLSSIFFLVVLSLCIYALRKGQHVAVNSVLLGVLILSECFFNLVDRIFIIVTTAKILYNTNLQFGDSWRLLFYYIGRISGSFSAPFIYDFFGYLITGHLSICVISLIAMLVRKGTLSDPRYLFKRSTQYNNKSDNSY